MGYRIGIDVGGTFTDFLLVDGREESRVCKVLSTPADPSEAVLGGLREMAAGEGLELGNFLTRTELIVHGTTVTTNAVLTGQLARTGLLTTEGFRDALQMRRGIREKLYDNKYRAPAPIVARRLRLPVRERTDVTGHALQPVDKSEVEACLAEFRRAGVEAVAICFMHAYANPANERAAAEVVREKMPAAYLSVSSEVLPQVRFYERISTTVLNSAVGPILSSYLGSLAARLEADGFAGALLIMQSNGGVTTPSAAVALAASTLLSGPAAAPAAGLAYAELGGERSFITVDMGGTSFDAAMVKDGAPSVSTSGSVDRFAMALPAMEINTVGAGGGSIAWINEGGLLRMGPRSAGAQPGPACYGLGGQEPTCSDANLLLGYLSADFFAGGRMLLDGDAARRAIEERIARPLGMEAVEAAAGMYRVMNVNMASAMREISVRKGYDPREFLMICAGGAGPVHAAMIARELGMSRILIPRESSIFCAAGMLRSDLKHDFVRTFNALLPEDGTEAERVQTAAGEMEAEGRRLLSGESIAPERQRMVWCMDLRYLGQYHEVAVELPAEAVQACDAARIRRAFHAAHDRLYGYALAEQGTAVELINLRLSAIGVTDKPPLRKDAYRGEQPDADAVKGRRPVYLPHRQDFAEVTVFDGDALGHGNQLQGPAIIEQVNTTIFVPAGASAACDAYGSFLLTWNGNGREAPR